MQQNKTDVMSQFVMDWLRMTDENPELVLGDWLHTFSIMTGISMRLAGVQEDNVQEAIDRMGLMIHSAFENSQQGFKPSVLQ